MDPTVLDRATRRAAVAAELGALDADLVCLQETTPIDLAAIVTLLGDDVIVHSAPNSPELWASWSTPELPGRRTARRCCGEAAASTRSRPEP